MKIKNVLKEGAVTWKWAYEIRFLGRAVLVSSLKRGRWNVLFASKKRVEKDAGEPFPKDVFGFRFGPWCVAGKRLDK